MGKQLSILGAGAGPEPSVDRARTALAVKPRRTRELPTIGFLPILEDEFRPAIRSKRIKTSAPRMLRTGDRPQSLGTATLTREERLFKRLDEWNVEGETFGPPKTFGECATKGPCIHVGCRHHNYLEVTGNVVKLNFPHIGPEEMKEPCSLRVAIRAAKRMKPRGPHGEAMSHQEVSEHLGLTAERTRQIEGGVLKQIKEERGDLE